ncbi:hypothetical protein FKM82_007255 [Ascaphus truei]
MPTSLCKENTQSSAQNKFQNLHSYLTGNCVICKKQVPIDAASPSNICIMPVLKTRTHFKHWSMTIRGAENGFY